MIIGARAGGVVTGSPTVSVARMLPAVSRPLTVTLGLAAVIQQVLGLGLILVTGRLIGHVPDALQTGIRGALLISVVLLAVVYAGLQIVAAVAAVVQTLLGHRLDSVLADRLMRVQLGPPGLAHLEDPSVQDLAERAGGGLAVPRWRPAEAPGALAALVSGGLTAGLACAAVVWLQWWLGILLAGTVVWTGYELYAHLLRMTPGLGRG